MKVDQLSQVQDRRYASVLPVGLGRCVRVSLTAAVLGSLLLFASGRSSAALGCRGANLQRQRGKSCSFDCGHVIVVLNL